MKECARKKQEGVSPKKGGGHEGFRHEGKSMTLCVRRGRIKLWGAQTVYVKGLLLSRFSGLMVSKNCPLESNPAKSRLLDKLFRHGKGLTFQVGVASVRLCNSFSTI